MSVPFIDLKRFENNFLDQWLAVVSSMTTRAEFIGGNQVTELEKRLSDRIQVSHAVSCANGTDALQLALRAIGVGREDLVLIPNMTFWATFEAVVNVGACPVTVDIDPSDGGVDLTAFSDAIIKFKPKAAIIAHLYGWASAKLEQIRSLCAEHGVLLVEDGAQCFGVEFNGEPIYKNALISTTSFYPAKVLGAAGDGGAVFTNNAALANKVRTLGNHGRSAHYGYSDCGWNSRLDSLQAAFLNLSLDHLSQRLSSRRAAVAHYKSALADIAITHIAAPDMFLENGYANVCLIEDPNLKSTLEATLKSSGIGFGNIYPGAISAQEGAKEYLRGHVGGNNAQKFSQQVINLPLFPYMQTAELTEITETVRSVLTRG